MIKPMDKKRSGKWGQFKKKFLQGKVCAVCGSKKGLEAHHIVPFHFAPDRELDETNLIALCEGDPKINCHLFVGHLGNYRGVNPDVVTDAAIWLGKLTLSKKRLKEKL